MKIFLNTILAGFMATLSLTAQPGLIQDTLAHFEPATKSNSFNISPLNGLFGSVGGNYEHLFGSRHGLLLEGGSSFGSDYDMLIGYRYHYYSEADQYGLISPFWGFFVSKGKGSGKYEDPDTKIKHKLNIDLLTVGIHWGQRFAWGESFNYNWRIGYGYPVILDLNWPQGKPGEYKTIEKIIKVFSGLDGELSVGILF